jgi:hypothetical protein
LARTPWVARQFGPLYPILRQVKAIFDPTQNMELGRTMRRDFQRYSFPAPVRIGGIAALAKHAERSWKSQAELIAQWDKLFADLEALGHRSDEIDATISKRAEAIGALVEKTELEVRRSPYAGTLRVVQRLASDFSMMSAFMGKLMQEGVEVDMLPSVPRFLLNGEPLYPDRVRGWLTRLPQFAAREHVLLEGAALAELGTELSTLAAGRATIKPGEFKRRLDRVLREAPALTSLHAVTAGSEPYTRVAAYEEGDAPMTIERMIAQFDAIVKAAPEALVDNPDEKLAAFVAALDELHARRAKMEEHARTTEPAAEKR